ncbi:helix-turn-helix transcriptional regulator [Dactylosporangium matsuzakiense]|uniref:helix-turn-helix transcriptional regulator n=1 Tax=Dactylosporangium matsuzakiense TaxID=53360 RepID=UPI00220BFB85|nr:AAA family ATPase [Dactylosporangium matsuzakiense]UWZ41814.1 AAA family ATPase [Dactylosporangium matsuzakiense]
MVVASTVQKHHLRGRDDDLAAATALLDRAADAEGGALILTGPPGIGRTALLRAVAAHARAAATTVLTVTGYQAELPFPFAALHRLLSAYPASDIRPAADPLTAHERTAGPAARRRSTRSDQPVRHDHPIRYGHRLRSDRLAAGLAVLATLRDLAATGPVAVLVDDAHALDRPSLDALAVAARRAGGERIALLFTLRDTPAGTAAADTLAGLPHRRLAPLDPRESRYLLADAVPELAGDVAGVLAARAGGNPRALTELASALTGEQRRGETPPPTTPLRTGDLSREYRAALRALPPATRRALILAATSATTTAAFPAAPGPASAPAADTPDGGGTPGTGTAGDACPTALLLAAGVHPDELAPAEHAELIHTDDTRVHFVAPLFAAVVYAEATLAERHAAHRRLATLTPALPAALHRAAVATGPDDTLAEALAAAGTPPGAAAGPAAAPGHAATALQRAAQLTTSPIRAAEWTLHAARLAWRAGEPYRARLLLRTVFATAVPASLHAERDLLLGEIELRTGAHADARQTLLTAATRLPPARALRALVLAGEALAAAGRHHQYTEIADRVAALHHQPPDQPPPPSRPTGPEPPAPHERPATGVGRAAGSPGHGPVEALLFEYVAGMAAGYAGEPARAGAPLARVIALAAACDEPAALVRAAWAGIVTGRDEDAHRLAGRAARLARGAADRATEPMAAEAAATAALALGDLDLAATTAAEGRRLAVATGQDAVADTCCGLLAVIAGMLGDADGCRRWVRRCRARAGADIDSQARAMCVWAAALIDVAEGRHADAAGRLWAVMRTEVGRGHLGVQVPAIPTLVEASVRCGEPGAARPVLAAYDLWAASTANPTWLALSARCHGLLAASDDEADSHFREALRLHLAGDSAFPGARTELLYGEELRRHRRPAAAREHLRSALATFEQYGAAPWARRAAAELRAAGDHVDPPGPAGAEPGPELTAQQARIAHLVAGGATNREIAAALFVSPRTVEHHLRNIFVRLGVRSRTELARALT